ncbi:MAG: DUF6456 domain-containing protein [Beijerinckiaceae bacterium]|nr:DUF6456 domain-containing protein [Beijerinckiaceae bacterium]
MTQLHEPPAGKKPAGKTSARAATPRTRPAPDPDPRETARLLERLAEPGMRVEAQRGRLVFRDERRRVSLASRFPASLLEPLLGAGAIRALPGGAHVITPEGRARLKREAGGEVASQHREIVFRPEPELAGQVVAVNLREDPLQMLRRQRHVAHLVGPAEIEAGLRLRADLRLAGTIPTITMDWTRPAVDGSAGEGLALGEQVVAARQRVDRALRAVGPDFSGILVDICGFGKGVEALEREQALPVRSGKIALAFALRVLARHYGLDNLATGLRAGRIQAVTLGR